MIKGEEKLKRSKRLQLSIKIIDMMMLKQVKKERINEKPNTREHDIPF